MTDADQYVAELFGLPGKCAVVIGGGGHLCSAMATAFAKSGCKVAVLDLRPQKAKEIEDDLRRQGFSDVIHGALDVTVRQDHERALAMVVERLGPIDILVNGAGTNSSTPFFDVDIEDWQAVMDSQITGTFLGCQVFGQHMVAKGSGSIINISSASAGPPLSKAFAYSAAKAGIRNLTMNLGREWAQQGVRVNALRPGFFPTEWNRKNFITPEREKAILGHTPMGRFGEPSELVGAVIWLASDASRFVTGAEINVDGGYACMSI
jgi:NAD(P)-dependent dehydrogenase (short-subunit alcohol dehydrogenase family)